MSTTKISQIVDSVPVKNRIVDGSFTQMFDGELVTWTPGEVKHLPRSYAEWFVHKSCFKFDIAGGKHGYRLCIVGVGADESDLTAAEVAAQKELIDREKLGPTMFTPDGKPLTPTTVPLSGLAGQIRAEEMKIVDAERAAKDELRAERFDAAVEKLAAAAEKLSPAEIDAAAAEIARPRAAQ
jgi:hypothetical protein